MEQKLNLHNRYDIEVVDSRTGKMRQKAQAENIILDGAWGQILNNTSGSWFNSIAYGTGTGTMSAARTALFTPLSSKVATDSVYTLDNANNYVSHRQKIVILENEHVGAQLSEVGIMSSRSGTPLCTHALIKDMNGNPVVITKTDTDIITIYATVYLLIGTTYSPTSTLDIARCDPEDNGIIRTLLGRPIGYSESSYNFTGFNFVFSAVQGTQIISNEGDAYTSERQVATLDVPNKRARFYYRVPAADANVGGFILGAIKLTAASYAEDYPSIICRFTSGGLTQAQVVEQIGVGDGIVTDFATSFSHIPSNTVVKVDGVPASPTIMADMPNQSVINGFFREFSENPNIQNKMPLFGAKINVDVIWENMSNYPVTSIQARGVNISGSNDGVTFSPTIFTSNYTETQEVPEEYQGHKYWKISPMEGATNRYIYNIYSDGFSNYKNVRFAVAPANGAVITAEYTPLCAAKDANHVLDIDITIQLGEHVD